MRAGVGTVRLCTVIAVLLAAVAGCSGGNQVEPSYGGPAATQAAAPESPAQDLATEPDIVTTGSVRMTVADPVAAADEFASATVDAGGRVESRSEQSGSSVPSVNMTLRIPSDEVDTVLADVDELGVIDSKSIDYDDVTSQRVDLDARIKALQTSVNRLLELMTKAASTEDLLAAESSLTERQAELDSLQAQRATLGDQIAYATITADLSSEPTVSRQGFLGAIQQGWRALVGAASGLARIVGFLLPWAPVFLVIGGGIYWAVRRTQRRPTVTSGWQPPPSQSPAPPPPTASDADPGSR